MGAGAGSECVIELMENLAVWSSGRVVAELSRGKSFNLSGHSVKSENRAAKSERFCRQCG